MIETSPTDSMEFEGYGSNAKPQMPYYKDGQFFSADGKGLSPKDVIRDGRHPDNVDSLQFVAPFSLDDLATPADFARAMEQVWDVCSPPILLLSMARGEFLDYFPWTNEWIVLQFSGIRPAERHCLSSGNSTLQHCIFGQIAL